MDGTGRCASAPSRCRGRNRGARSPVPHRPSRRARNGSSDQKRAAWPSDRPRTTSGAPGKHAGARRLHPPPSPAAPRSQATRHLPQLSRGLSRAHLRSRRACHDDEIESRGKGRCDLAETLAHDSLDSVPGHGVSNLSGDSDTKPGVSRQRRGFRAGTRTDEDQEVLAADLPPLALDRQKLTPLAQATLGWRNGRQGEAQLVSAEARLLLRDANRELLAPLTTATSQDLSPGGGLHALAESMRSLAALTVGLKRPLHD